MKICLDPGHSGPVEPGACAGGFTEAQIVLQVAQTLRGLLEEEGHKVILTREDDIEDDGLEWRAELAWKFKADIFVSLHCNAAASASAHGTEVFYYPGSERGRKLACLIQAALVANCNTVDRGVKTNDKWTVLTDTACPAVLVELAFISNAEDRAQLTDRFLQRQFAVGVMRGIAAFAQGGALFSGAPEKPETQEIRGSVRNR